MLEAGPGLASTPQCSHESETTVATGERCGVWLWRVDAAIRAEQQSTVGDEQAERR